LETDLKPEQLDLVEMIYSCGKNLLVIVNEILDFSKLDSGKLELSYDPFDVIALGDDIIDLFALKAQNKGLDFSLMLPYQYKSLLIGDVGRIRQIFVNLVGNAIKFTENGSIHVAIEIDTTDPAKSLLKGKVVDTGVGIAPEYQARLFKAFTQVDSSFNRRFGGTGLGLVICKRLCQAMGGDVGVQSALGEGSTFQFTIPLRSTDSPVPLAPVDPELKEMNIVILSGCKNLKPLFESLGLKLTLTTSPQALFQLVRQKRIDLVIISSAFANIFEIGEKIIDISRATKRKPILVGLIKYSERKLLSKLRKANFFGHLLQPAKRSHTLAMLKRVHAYWRENRKAGNLQLETPIVPREQYRIMVVDDNFNNLEFAAMLLKKFGYNAVTASSGKECLDLLETLDYDMILMDVQMPQMNGLEVARRIREKVRNDRF